MPLTGLPWYERDYTVASLTDKNVAPTLRVAEPKAAIAQDAVGFTLDEWMLIEHPALADELERDCGD